MVMEISTRQLRALLAVADSASFTKAAETVYVTQPALSAQIRGLEELMGGRLFQRTQRGAVLTPLGRAVERHARVIASEHAKLASLARRGDDFSVEVAIGLIPTVAPYLLPGTLEQLAGGERLLNLSVHELTSADLVTQLRAGRLDAAVLALPYELPEDLVARPLFADPFLLIGRPAEVDALPADPASLDTKRLLLLDEGHCLADQALSLCNAARARTRTDVSAASLSTVCRLAEAGFGVTLLPALAAPVEQRPSLRIRRMRGEGVERQICLVHDRALDDEPWLDTLTEALRAAGCQLVGEGVALGA